MIPPPRTIRRMGMCCPPSHLLRTCGELFTTLFTQPFITVELWVCPAKNAKGHSIYAHGCHVLAVLWCVGQNRFQAAPSFSPVLNSISSRCENTVLIDVILNRVLSEQKAPCHLRNYQNVLSDFVALVLVSKNLFHSNTSVTGMLAL